MKITDRTIKLTRAEMRLLEDRGPDGDAFRHQVRKTAREIARATNNPVAVETPDYTADQVFPD